MTIVERIQPDQEKEMDIPSLVVNDVEIFKLDMVRYLNAQRRKKNIKVHIQIKETGNTYE
jgi:hypothetical protein